MQNESRTKKKWQKVASHRLIFEKDSIPLPFLKQYLNVIVLKVFLLEIETGKGCGARGNSSGFW
jgi:hypothetical protein